MGREWAGSPRDPPARPVQGTVQGRRPAGKASSQKAGPRGSAKRCHQAPADRQPEKPRGAQGRAPPRPEGRGQGRRGGAVQACGPDRPPPTPSAFFLCLFPPLEPPGWPLDFPRWECGGGGEASLVELGEDKEFCPLRQADNSPRQGTRPSPRAGVKPGAQLHSACFLLAGALRQITDFSHL